MFDLVPITYRHGFTDAYVNIYWAIGHLNSFVSLNLLIATVKLVNDKAHKPVFWQIIDRGIRKLDKKQSGPALIPSTDDFKWMINGMEKLDAVKHKMDFLSPRGMWLDEGKKNKLKICPDRAH